MNPYSSPELHVLEYEENKKHPQYKTLHLPGADKHIYSPHVVEQLPTAWSAMHWGELQYEYDNDHYDDKASMYIHCSYSLKDRAVSLIKRVIMSVTVPEIIVNDAHKDTIRVAWTSNLAYAVIQEAAIDVGGARPYPLSRHALKVTAVAMCNDAAEVAELDFTCGNRPQLTNWTTNLEATQVGFTQPFFFNRLESGLICYTVKPVTFEYEFELRVAEWLRCEKLEDGTWKAVRPEPAYFQRMPHRLPMPRLTGQFFYNSKYADLKLTSDSQHTFRFTDIVEMSAPNPTDCQQIMNVVMDKDLLVKAALIVVENTTMQKRQRQSCHYTSDVAEVKVEYDHMTRMVLRGNPVVSRIMAATHFGHTLPEWMHALSWVHEPWDNMESDVALSRLSAKIQIMMKQQMLDEDLYRYHAFFLVQRTIHYDAVGKQDAEKSAIQFKVSIV